MKEHQSELYGAAAYRGSDIPALAPGEGGRGGLMQTPLAWGNYAGLDSFTEVESQLETRQHKIYEQQAEEHREQIVFCDALRWRFQNTSQLPYFLFVTKWCCFGAPWLPWAMLFNRFYSSSAGQSVFFAFISAVLVFGSLFFFGTRKQHYIYWLLGGGAAVTAAVICWHEGALWGFWREQTAFWVGLWLAFYAVIGADLLLALYARFFQHDGSEFNRRTGMVSIARRFRKPFTAPFYEFDPVMQLMVTPHGGHDYGLWLYHRYTGTRVCLAKKMHGLGLDRSNLMAFWDTLQRYMDVEQPLPDIPVLEQSRHLDPVTAEHDRQVGRPARYWRDMGVRNWKRKQGKALREALAAYPWQQHSCVLQARIEPGLSIEAYYRQQEAKGIDATATADDYDLVRRG